MVKIEFEPLGRRVEVPEGTTLLQAAQAAGVGLIAVCGGAGTCYSCRVRLISGSLSQITPDEQASFSSDEVEQGWRLACQAVAHSDVQVDIPLESLSTPQRLQIEGQAVSVAPDPDIRIVEIKVPAPSAEDLRDDLARLQGGLKAAGVENAQVGLPVMGKIPGRLRSMDWSARVVLRGNEVAALLKPNALYYGLAVDIGTTKLAAYLVDLETGQLAAQAGAMNPQIAYGEDVVSRVAYATKTTENADRLRRVVIDSINDLIGELRQDAGITDPDQLVEAVVVGNTAMHHLFTGLPTGSLGHAPYVAAVTAPLELPASQTGLDLAPGACVYLPANIAGYVGADHTAALLATQIWQNPRRAALLVDIGTNTEITLAAGGRLMTCSCASGPAFEGAHITAGMRAAPGAIEHVRRTPEGWRWFTIEGQAPVGLCGSGVLDAIAEMAADGVIDARGALQTSHPKVHTRKGGKEFVLVPPEVNQGNGVAITRKDVNEIQLAKGAIRAGIEVLLEKAGLATGDIQHVALAGAFGTYLDVHSALGIGMFPAIPEECFQAVGNAAGAGARLMLVAQSQRRLAEAVARQVEYVELTTYPGFTEVFINSLGF